jgi:hypothetical protein
MTGLPRRVSGEAVYATLGAAAPAGVTKQELLDATGLSTNQVSLGLAWVRDIAATEHATPLTWDHRHGYRLDDNDGTWTAYEPSQIRTRLGSLSRFVKAPSHPTTRGPPTASGSPSSSTPPPTSTTPTPSWSDATPSWSASGGPSPRA